MAANPALLRQARDAHEAGARDQAEALYRKAAALGASDANHWLARLLVEGGRPADALDAAQTAVQHQPRSPFAHEALGLALKALDRLDEAVAAYQRAIELDPLSFGAWYNFGNVHRAADRFEDAAASYRRATRVNPGQAWAWNNLGDCYRALGRPEDSADAYHAALLLMPDTPEIRFNLGRVQLDCRRYADAAHNLRAVTDALPGHAAAWHLLGKALEKQHEPDHAVAAYRTADRLQPGNQMIRTDLAGALQKAGHVTEAETIARQVLHDAPESTDARANLANLLDDMGRSEEALALLDDALLRAPVHANAQLNLAMLHLRAGRLQEGFRAFRYRWEAMGVEPLLPGAPWQGEPIAGKTLLVHEDQGFGDFIQFYRFVPLAAQQAAHVMLQAPAALQRLLRAQGGSWRLLGAQDLIDKPPHFDLHCPILDLPGALGISQETLPAAPYLHAEPERVSAWRARVAGLPGRRIGLAWAGNPEYPHDRARSAAFSQLAPLASVPDVSFVSLQQGGAAWTRRSPEAVPMLHDWTAELTDFAETAALITALDLVIAVDTSVAHLAGALGSPVWLLNRYDTDWRWLRNRPDSPWYPSMRIFRQPQPRDWWPVMTTVAQSLAELPGHRGC